MESTTFQVVEIDGVLADVRPVFNNLASAVLDKPVECAEELDPPHDLHRMSRAAGLDEAEEEAVRKTVYEITDFWVSVPATSPWRPVPLARIVFHARRLQTRGKPVLLQTIEWLNKVGYKNPVTWIEED